MRMTPARRHLITALAAKQAATARATNDHGETIGTAYDLQRAQLHQHMRDLKSIQSVEKKIEAKRRLLPEYDAYIDGVLSVRPGSQDEVIATTMIWHIDAGNYARALQLAEYMIASGMTQPDRYARTLETIIQEEIAEAVISGKCVGDEAFALVMQVMELTQTADTPDQVKAKLSKAAGWAVIGKTKTSDADIAKLAITKCQKALQFLEYAMQMDQNAGVKKDIERLARRVKAQA